MALLGDVQTESPDFVSPFVSLFDTTTAPSSCTLCAVCRMILDRGLWASRTVRLPQGGSSVTTKPDLIV
jgi:hypothetical protein